ncbi:MAG: TldD/PmbA family protein [Armatimonadetes bacterium]|nr:TldD/PmbA family protein [Armatimonadota bacterium]
MDDELNEQRALDAAEAAMQAAIAAGAEWADAVAGWGRSLSASFERSTIRETEASIGEGVGVRAFVKGGVGMAVANELNLQSARKVGETAAELARATSPDPDFKRLPEPQPLADEPASFDERLVGLPAGRLVEICTEAIDRARAVRDCVFLAGGASADAGVWAMVSCTGIAVARRSSAIGMSVHASVWEGDAAASYADGTGARRLEDFQWQDIPARVVGQAARLLGERPIRTGRYDVILDFRNAYYWLTGVVFCCNAEDVQRKRSFMAGKEGDMVASQILTIVEDPFIQWGPSSAACDGEGVPTRKRNIIDHGVLTTYLHNSYTAGKAGVEPTGHAARGGWSPDVGIAASNLLVLPGDKPLAELIKEVDSGILVVMGEPAPDTTSGQVSETVDGGFFIRHGEVTFPVKGVMLTGNIFDYLKNIDAVSSDYRTEAGLIMPAVRIRDVQISAL